jgi:hypothetical protein
MPRTLPKLPLAIAINSVGLKGFTQDSSGGTSALVDFDGSPMYCHVTETAPGSSRVNIAFDLNPPSTYTDKLGHVDTITVTFKGAAPGLTFNPAGAVYSGGRLGYFLELTDDLSTATLQIEQPPSIVPQGQGTLGLIILGTKVTEATKPRAYFVDVPIGKNFEAVDAITVYWSDGGGLAGPIGSGVIPAGGP